MLSIGFGKPLTDYLQLSTFRLSTQNLQLSTVSKLQINFLNEENPLKKFAKFCKQTIFGDFFNKFIYRIHLLYIKRAQMSTLAIKNQLFVYRIFVTVI